MNTPPLHFKRVHVRRMPGVEGGFALDELSPGINVVFGPNGCGKSRTATAINTLLWPGGRDRASLSGLALMDGSDWRIDLDAGAVSYQRGGADSGPPMLPPADARDRYNLPLHDLLVSEAKDFAEVILRESTGGYDLKRLAMVVGARPGASGQGKEFTSVRQSAAKLEEAEDAQRKLLDDEQELSDLEERLARAEQAATRAERLTRAIQHRDAAKAHDAATAALSQYDTAISSLRGDELASLDRLRHDAREADAALRQARDELERCSRAVQDCGVGQETISDVLLKGVGARSQRLAELRAALDSARRDRAAAEAERKAARLRIGPVVSEEQLARVDAGGLAEIESFARQMIQTTAQWQAHEAMAEWVGRASPPVDIQRLNYAMRLLWRWLQTPSPAATTDHRPADHGRAPLIVAGILVAVLSLILALRVHWAFAPMALSPLLLLLVLPRRPVTVVTEDGRSITAADYARLNLPGPAGWTAEEVAAAADRLAVEIAAALLEEEKARRWDELSPRREQSKAAAKQLDVRRHFLAAHFGVAPDTDALSLVALASNVARWQDADARFAGASAKYESVLEQHGDEVATVSDLLRGHGFDVRDASDVAAALDALRDRQKTFELAAANHVAASAREVEATRRAEAARAAVTELFATVGLDDGDEPTLRRRLGQRSSFLAAQQLVHGTAAALQVAAAALPADAWVGEATKEQLAAELREARDVAARMTGARDAVVEIRTRVADAKRAANVEDALSKHGENIAALAVRREDDCDAVAAWVLTEYLRQENRDRHRPAVFHRARELFSRVTQGRYRLDFDDATDPPGFRAADTSTGAGHPIEELSGGTRLQLLLAVRVAFVEEQERGVKLPLLLDETLANSDETRARAIIDATIAIARSGRQVFYFTAQLDEVAKWKTILEKLGDVPYRLIDLAEARGLAATERLPLREIAPPVLPKVPEPDGLSRAEYAALLQVPAFDPSREEVGGTHLWHVVEDTTVLHNFLVLGVNTWGQLRTLRTCNGDTIVNGSADAYPKAAAAAKALEAMAEAWRVGRGRPVDRQAIFDSGAVTDKFVVPVGSLLESAGHDGLRLIEALEEGSVKNFRKEATANLRAYLVESGHIDERPRLTDDQIRARMLAAVAEEIRSGCFEAHRIDDYLACCGAGR